MWLVLLFAFILEFQTPASDGLVYSAMTRLEDLAVIESALLVTLDKYIAVEKSKLELVTKFADQVRKAHSSLSTNDTKEIFKSPLEVYTLIKRFAYQWRNLETHVQNNNSKGNLVYYQHDQVGFL